MSDLNLPLATAVRKVVQQKRRKYGELYSLVNDIIHDGVDIEHIITFLDESPSAVHRQFAEELREAFARVLKTQLREIERDLGADRFALYAALLDMYLVQGCPEALGGILSLNYDEYVEAAATAIYGKGVDYGLNVAKLPVAAPGLRLLKLHGSFNWDRFVADTGRTARR